MDANLIERAKCDGAALEQLVTALWPRAYRVAFTILRDRGLAEDAAQEACVAVARSLRRLVDPGAFHAWTYRVIVNGALAIARRRPAEQSLETLSREPATSAPLGDAAGLYDALATLSCVQRAMVLLHYYAGLRSGEIAAATGLSPATIRFHLMRARRGLRRALAANDAHARRAPKEILTDVR